MASLSGSLCYQLTVLIIVFTKEARTDTGSPYDNKSDKCSSVGEELKILQELLGQETTLRELKGRLENVTEDIVQLSKMKDLLLLNEGEMKRDIFTNRDHVGHLEQRLNDSIREFKIFKKDFTSRINVFEQSMEKTRLKQNNDTSDDSTVFCPANIVADTGLIQSGYAMIDCSDIHRRYPEGKSGTYRIYPGGGYGYTAYCDMVTDGGGWTVFQRRHDGTEDFFRGWQEYRNGFGNVTGEHWLGNKALYEISSHCSHCELRVDLEDFQGNRKYAKYANFSISSEADSFALNIGAYFGNAGDSLSYSKTYKFTTKDADNDFFKGRNCATYENRNGAWWFNRTHADTGSPYEDAKNKCPTNSEEMKILQELLGQETALRGLKVSLQNITEDISMLSKMKDLLFINDGERKRDISNNIQQIEQLAQIFNRSVTNVKIMEKNFQSRIEGLEKSLKALEKTVLKLENDTQTSDDQPMFCPANTVGDTGLVQSGYAMIDCSDIHRKYPEGKSGPYRIYPAGGAGYTVFCDMVTDGGGWTVFQRREDGSVDFHRTWKEYKDGFGNVTGEHWLGNRAISELSCHCPVCELRIDLEDFEGNRRYAKYSNFSVGKEEDGFTLEFGGYIGDAGDPLTAIHKGQKFTTKDRDQDKTKTNVNCAIKYQGAWWFNSCYRAHLNGQFFDGGKQNESWTGIIWDTWKGGNYSLKGTRMMMRKDHKQK